MISKLLFSGILRRSLSCCSCFAAAIIMGVTILSAPVYAQAQQNNLPFWPKFPESLKVQPTGLDIQHQSGSSAGIKVLGEGPGFVLIAKSDKSMIFATPPRLAPAWQVECERISCDLQRIASAAPETNSEEGLGRAAYQAALTFVALYTGFNENMTSRQIEEPSLPSLSNFKTPSAMNSAQKRLRSSLLQGFR